MKLSTQLVFPYRRIVIGSAQEADTVLARLEAVTVRREAQLRRDPSAEFVGRIERSGFRVLPRSTGRNTYRPWLRGTVLAEPSGASILATTTIHPVAAAVVLLFFGGAQYLSISGGTGFSVALLVAMLVFHVFMCAFGFMPEAEAAEERLRELAA